MFQLFLLLIFTWISTCCSELCSSKSLNQDCSKRLLNNDIKADQYCNILYNSVNGELCQKMKFGPITEKYSGLNVKLAPSIQYNEYGNMYITPNLTFTNITWKSIKFRYQMIMNKTVINHCQIITLTNNTISADFTLNYDCIWYPYNHSICGHKVDLDFETEEENGYKSGHFSFNIPFEIAEKNVSYKNWKPFIYLEDTIQGLKVNMEPPPANVGIQLYKVKVVELNKHLGDLVIDETYHNVYDQVISLNYSYIGMKGLYVFIVQTLNELCPDGVCTTSMSPIVKIDNPKRQVTVICIASMASLVFAVLFALFICRTHFERKYRQLYDARAKVLIITKSSDEKFKECIRKFTSCLKELGLSIVDENETLNSIEDDSYENELINSADYVLNIVSLKSCHCEKSHDKGYNAIINTIILNGSIRNINIVFGSRDYCMQVDLPKCLQQYETFYLTEEWPMFVNCLTKSDVDINVIELESSIRRYGMDLV